MAATAAAEHRCGCESGTGQAGCRGSRSTVRGHLSTECHPAHVNHVVSTCFRCHAGCPVACVWKDQATSRHTAGTTETEAARHGPARATHVLPVSEHADQERGPSQAAKPPLPVWLPGWDWLVPWLVSPWGPRLPILRAPYFLMTHSCWSHLSDPLVPCSHQPPQWMCAHSRRRPLRAPPVRVAMHYGLLRVNACPTAAQGLTMGSPVSSLIFVGGGGEIFKTSDSMKY